MSEPLPPLIERLLSADLDARQSALEEASALAKERGATAELMPPLLESLSHDVNGVRHGASTALGWLAYRCGVVDAALVGAALQCLDDRVPMVRHDGAWILESLAQAGMTAPEAGPALIRGTSHDVADVRAASIFCLSAMATAGVVVEGTVDAARARSDDDNETVRHAVQEALAACGVVG